jgi:hypothetical protein
MSETVEAEDEPDEESHTETTETSETTESTGGGSDDGIDFNAYLSLNDAEKDTLVDWVVFLAGISAAIGIAQGLNVLIQNQWAHDLIFAGPFYQAKNNFVNPETLIALTLFVLPFLGVLLALTVGHEEETPVKAAAVASFVFVVVTTMLGGFLGVVTVGALSINLVNTLVSSIGAGIAGAVGAIIAVIVTQEFAPDGLGS